LSRSIAAVASRLTKSDPQIKSCRPSCKLPYPRRRRSCPAN